MSVEENKAIARRVNDELWNKGNVDILDELFDVNYVGHPGLQNHEDFKQQAKEALANFPEMSLTFEDVIAQGDKVVFRWTWILPHTREFMGIAPTGIKIKRTGISIYRIVGGKVVEDWAASDSLGVWKQWGGAPDMNQVRESTWD